MTTNFLVLGRYPNTGSGIVLLRGMVHRTLAVSYFSRLPTILFPVDIYTFFCYNEGMRYILISLAMIPTVLQVGCHSPNEWLPGRAGHGRGFVNPLTVEEMKQAKCLATMVYGEARGESGKGKVAVAYTAMNRAGKKTVCGVVLAPKQYSIFNDNPALKAAAMSLHLEPRQKNPIDKNSWTQSTEIAELVIRKQITDPTKGATHYLADKVMKIKGYKYPRWSREYQLVAIVDNHKFYKQKERNI